MIRNVITIIVIFVSTHIILGSERSTIYMTKKPEPLIVPLGDEVSFECEMNIKPDKFQWRQFHLTDNVHDLVQFDTRNSVNMTSNQFRSTGKSSTLLVKVDSVLAAGDYQCLSYYGASVIVSVPGRLILAEIAPFPYMRNTSYTVFNGNTITLQCPSPSSQPTALIKYFRNKQLLDPNLVLATGSLLLENVTETDSGNYSCSATNYMNGDIVYSNFQIELHVNNAVKHEPPKFINVPPNNYTITAEKTLFMECAAYGSPTPTVKWTKLNEKLPNDRAEQIAGGLRIINSVQSDEGIYICQISNGKNSSPLIHHISVMFYEPPTVKINGLSTKQINEGENKEFECFVEKGAPEPQVKWLLNGHNVVYDKSIEAIGNHIYFNPIEKRHAGVLQCFATNQVGSSFDIMFLSVYPKQIHHSGNKSVISHDDSNSVLDDFENRNNANKANRRKRPRNRLKNSNMVPPSRPNITRLSDESVMVRWSVPKNNGVPISFFKIQYRNLGPTNSSRKKSGWKTPNSDISPFINSFEIENLLPDHYYRFRVAAVYANNDHKLGPHSVKYFLQKADFFAKNPLPIPKLTHTEAVDYSAIKIYWEFEPSENITADGYFVHYLPGNSAGDYMKATIEGQDNRDFIINHLQPDTYYDIKLQSFTSQLASDFSAILKQKTMRLVKENITIVPAVVTTEGPKIDMEELYYVYEIMVPIIIGCSLIGAAVIVFLLVKCDKKEKKPRAADSNKVNGDIVDDTKSNHKHPSNGTSANNTIKITLNPLADAEHTENESEIEMNCLTTPKEKNNAAASSTEFHNNNNDNNNREFVVNIKDALNRLTPSLSRKFPHYDPESPSMTIIAS